MNTLLSYASEILKQVLAGEEVNLSGFRKLRITGLADQLQRIADKYNRFYVIAEQRYNSHGRSIVDITIITDDMAIVEVAEKGKTYGYFYIVNGRASSTYSEDKESAVLLAIGEKYEGNNSQFQYYACKMLGKF